MRSVLPARPARPLPVGGFRCPGAPPSPAVDGAGRALAAAGALRDRPFGFAALTWRSPQGGPWTGGQAVSSSPVFQTRPVPLLGPDGLARVAVLRAANAPGPPDGPVPGEAVLATVDGGEEILGPARDADDALAAAKSGTRTLVAWLAPGGGVTVAEPGS